MRKVFPVGVALEQLKRRMNDEVWALADHASYALSDDAKKELAMLANFTAQAQVPSQVLDYLKRRTSHQNKWRHAFPGDLAGEAFGVRLVKLLSPGGKVRALAEAFALEPQSKAEAESGEEVPEHVRLKRVVQVMGLYFGIMRDCAEGRRILQHRQ